MSLAQPRAPLKELAGGLRPQPIAASGDELLHAHQRGDTLQFQAGVRSVSCGDPVH